VNFLDLQTFNPKLSSMGGNYLSFLVIGTIYVGLMSVGQSSFAETISEEQSLGTLEQLFVSKCVLHNSGTQFCKRISSLLQG
jgi:hypothetical protein